MRASYIFRMGGSGGMNTAQPNVSSVQDMPPKGGYPRVSYYYYNNNTIFFINIY